MQKKDTSTSTGRKMLRYLLAGVTVTVPVVLSMMAIWWFYGWIDAAFRYPVDWFEWAFEIHVPRFFANLAALALTLTAIGFLGWFVATRIGRWFHDRFDGFFARVNPLYPPIKKSVGLILDTLGSDDGLFSRVVTVSWWKTNMCSSLTVTRIARENLVRTLSVRTFSILDIFLLCVKVAPVLGSSYFVVC